MRLLRRKPRDEKADRLAQQKREVGPNGWTCHVCGDYRPDALIGVYSSLKPLVPWMSFRQNVRYCNDRSACRAGAPNVDFGGGRDG